MSVSMGEQAAIADVTLKDIAESIGVNASTVSRALDLAKAHLVKEETIARVRGGEAPGYCGDHVAGSLRPAGDGDRRGDRRRPGQPVHRPGDPRHRQDARRRADAPPIFETQDDPEQLQGVDGPAQPPGRRDHRRRRPLRRPQRPRGSDLLHPGGDRRARHPGSPLPHVLHDDRGGRGAGGTRPDRPRPHPPRRAARPDGRRQLRRPPRGLP